MGLLDAVKKLVSGEKPPSAAPKPSLKCPLCSAPKPEYRESIACYYCSSCGYVWRP